MGFLEDRNLNSVPTIPEYYKGKTIFITGGSGFIGKVLIEKLLYSCTKLNKIYLLMRIKKGVTGKERLSEIYSSECFNRLKIERPGVFDEKVFVVEGDLSENGLDILEDERRKLINQVDIIFHTAANVRFDDHLSDAIKLNLKGTIQILELAKEIKHLSALVHISTTYSNTNQGHCVEEAIYTPHVDWRDALEICDKIDKHTLEVLTPKDLNLPSIHSVIKSQCRAFFDRAETHPNPLIAKAVAYSPDPLALKLFRRPCNALADPNDKITYLNDMPNPYVFSKQLAEHAVYDYRGQLPAVILRPSIVVNSLNEPMPGWIDNFNGPIGICVGGGKGIIHCIYAKSDVKCDYITVDSCVKNIIAVSWIRGTKELESTDDIPIYNCCSTDQIHITMKEMMESASRAIQDTPFDNALWAITNVTITTSRVIYCTKVILMQLLPALLIDALLYSFGRKPKLIKIQRTIYRAMLALEHYMTNDWIFKNDNSLSLCSHLKEKDRHDFYYNIKGTDVDFFFYGSILTMRRYLLREKDENLSKAKAHAQRLWWLDKFVKIIIFTFISVYVLIIYSY